MRLTDETYIISALSQAIADSLPIGPVTIAWDLARNGKQFDAAISAAIDLKDLCNVR